MASFDQIITHYFETIDSGEFVDPLEFMAAYPDHAEPLRKFFDDLGMIEKIIQKIDPASECTDRLGVTLGDYQIVRELGRGGMGTVYEAEQVSVPRRVALKVLHGGAAIDPERLQRFRNEARAAARLNHEHIASIYSVGEHEGTHFFAMQLIDGATLTDVIDARSSPVHLDTADDRPHDTVHGRPLSSTVARSFVEGSAERSFYQKVAGVVATVAETLHHAHQNGIIHRDIKPSNLLLDETGKVWVTDFGLARLETSESLTTTGDILGTLQYMSPEQASASEVDHRTDIYSLGVVLYQLLTEQLPFGGHQRLILRRVMNDDPIAPRQVNHGIPFDLETICLKCLRKNPAHRYESAEALAEDLKRYQRSEPIKARPTSWAERTYKWCWRHPAASAAVLVSVLASTLLVCLSLRHAFVVENVNESLRAALAESKRLGEEATRAEVDANKARDSAVSSSEELRLELYSRDMKTAYEAFDIRWTKEVKRLLDRHVSPVGSQDHRDYAWEFLSDYHRRPEPIELLLHTAPIERIEVFPDQKRLASVDLEGHIRIWDLTSHQQDYMMRDRRPTRDFAIAVSDAIARIWREPSSNSVSKVRASINTIGRGYRSLAISPDGKYLATGNLMLCLWDLESRTRVRDLTCFETRISDIKFSPDGKLIAAQSADRELRILNRNGDLIKQDDTNPSKNPLAFCEKHHELVAHFREGEKSGLRAFDTQNWKVIRETTVPLRFCVMSPEGDLFLTAGRSEVKIVEYPSGKIIGKISPFQFSISTFAISSARRTVAIGYSDGTLRIRRYSDYFQTMKEEEFIAAHDSAVNGVRFIDRNRVATCGDDRAIRIWEPRTSPTDRTFRHASIANSFRFVPGDEARIVATTARGFVLFDSGGAVLDEVDLWDFDQYLTIEVDPQGRYVAVAGESHTGIRIWNLQTQQVKRIAQARKARDIAFSPDGRWLARANTDHTIRLTTTEDWVQQFRFATIGHAVAIAFSPDNQRLAYADSEGAIVLRTWDDKSWTESAQLELGYRVINRGLLFTPDGSQVITAHEDSAIRVWDSKTLKKVGEMVGTTAIRQLALHPDGKILASANRDGTLRLWHLPTRSQIGRFAEGERVIFSPTGQASTLERNPDTGAATIKWYSPSE